MTKVLQYDDNGGMQETDISSGGLTNFTESTYTYSSKTGVKLTPNNAATDVDVVLQPKGTGAIIAQQPNGGATGGNNRGSRSVDLQLYRTYATQVASGTASVIVGGYNNTVSNDYSTIVGGTDNNVSNRYSVIMGGSYSAASGSNSVIVGGSSNISSGNYSSSFGTYTVSNKYGQFAHSSARFAAPGDAQTSELLLRKQTTDATANVELFLDGSSARLTLVNNSILSCYVMITGKTSAAVTGYSYHRKVVIARGTTAASTTLLQLETIGTDYETNAAADIAITADTTNGSLKITVTGIAATTINWLALVKNIEVVKA